MATATERMFPIQDGPDIPWSLAEEAYQEYSRLFGTQQNLERLAERHGFGEKEMDMLVPDWRERRF